MFSQYPVTSVLVAAIAAIRAAHRVPRRVRGQARDHRDPRLSRLGLRRRLAYERCVGRGVTFQALRLDFDDVGELGELSRQVQVEELAPPPRAAARCQHRGEVERGCDDEPQAVGVRYGGGAGRGAYRVTLLRHRGRGPDLGIVQYAVCAGRDLAGGHRLLERGRGGEGDDQPGRHTGDGLLPEPQDLVDLPAKQPLPGCRVLDQPGQRLAGDEPGGARRGGLR
jgi:hypothetical protein